MIQASPYSAVEKNAPFPNAGRRPAPQAQKRVGQEKRLMVYYATRGDSPGESNCEGRFGVQYIEVLKHDKIKKTY